MYSYCTYINADSQTANDFPAEEFYAWSDFERFYSAIEFIMQKDKVLKARKVLDWLDEHSVYYTLSWEKEVDNFIVANFFFLYINVHESEDAMLFKLTWG